MTIVPLTGLLETALYVDNVERAAAFYRALFGFETLFADARSVALSVGGGTVLLLFKKGATTTPLVNDRGTIPPHDGNGRLHVAFSIPAEALPIWERRLAEHGVTIEGRYQWPRGGTSVYFRDPDGHLLELVTPGCWAIY